MATTHAFEIEVTLDGKVSRYRPATRWDPAEGGEVYDLEITDVGTLSLNMSAPRGSLGRYVTKSIMTGVDANNPEVRKLLDNLLEAIRHDAEQAVYEDAA